MRPLIAGTIGTVLLLGVGSAGFAQGRGDAGDRSQRGDSEEFRDTIRQERLKKPVYPLWNQTAPRSGADEKARRDRKKK
jgi:hypothetical protein